MLCRVGAPGDVSSWWHCPKNAEKVSKKTMFFPRKIRLENNIPTIHFQVLLLLVSGRVECQDSVNGYMLRPAKTLVTGVNNPFIFMKGTILTFIQCCIGRTQDTCWLRLLFWQIPVISSLEYMGIFRRIFGSWSLNGIFSGFFFHHHLP